MAGERPSEELQAKWEAILKRQGLGMGRGHPKWLSYVGSSNDLAGLSDGLGNVICSKCIGIHTYEGDCGLSGPGGAEETSEEGLAELC